MSHDEFAANCPEGHPMTDGDSFCSKCGAKSSTDGSKRVAQDNAFSADADEIPSPMATGNGLSGRFSRKALIGGAVGISALVLLLLVLLWPSGSNSDFGIPGLAANQPLLHCVTPLATDLSTLTSKSINEATGMANNPFVFGLSPTSPERQAVFSAYGTYVSAVSSRQSKADAYVTGVREIGTFCRNLIGQSTSESGMAPSNSSSPTSAHSGPLFPSSRVTSRESFNICPTSTMTMSAPFSGPLNLELQVPLRLASSMAKFTDAGHSQATVGPRDWSCGASIGSSAILVIQPASQSRANPWPFENSTDRPTGNLEAIEVSGFPQGGTQEYENACKYFPTARAWLAKNGLPTSDCNMASGEKITTVSSTLVQVADPPGVGLSLGNNNPSLSLISLNPNAQGQFDSSVTCTMPTKQLAACRAVLASFRTSIDGSSAPGRTTASDPPTTTTAVNSQQGGGAATKTDPPIFSPTPPLLQSALVQYFTTQITTMPIGQLAFSSYESTQDPSWAIYSIHGAPGFESQIQSGEGLAHLVSGQWQVFPPGTVAIGCNSGVPESIAAEFGLGAAGTSLCEG